MKPKKSMKNSRTKKSGLVSRLITPVALGIGSLLYMGNPKEAPAQDLVRYVVPGPDPVNNWAMWNDTCLELGQITTTGTKTIYLGEGNYRYGPGALPPRTTGIRHIGQGKIPFSLDNSENDIKGGVRIYRAGFQPPASSHFENMVFSSEWDTEYDCDLINICAMDRGITFKNCAFVGDSENKTKRTGFGTKTSNYEEKSFTLENCKFLTFKIAILSGAPMEMKGCRISDCRNGIQATKTTIDGLSDPKKDRPNVIDLSNQEKPRFLIINPEESTGEVDIGLTMVLYGKEGVPVLDTTTAREYFLDLRKTSTTTRSIEEIAPGVRVEFVNPEPPTSTANGWEHYE